MTDTVPLALSAIQIVALRRADRLVFRHTPDKGSQIEAIKDNKATNADPFAQEIVVTVPCAFAADDYGGHGSEEYPNAPKAFTWDALSAGTFWGFDMFHSPKSDAIWQTVAGALRAGDVVRLRWMRGAGTSPALYKAGVVADSLRLYIERNGKPAGAFNLATHAVAVCSAESHRLMRTRAY